MRICHPYPCIVDPTRRVRYSQSPSPPLLLNYAAAAHGAAALSSPFLASRLHVSPFLQRVYALISSSLCCPIFTANAVYCPDIGDTLSMQIEMHHYTFVRRDISCKMRNVSNRDNHDGAKVCSCPMMHTRELNIIVFKSLCSSTISLPPGVSPPLRPMDSSRRGASFIPHVSNVATCATF
jgi:hypothetical protein